MARHVNSSRTSLLCASPASAFPNLRRHMVGHPTVWVVNQLDWTGLDGLFTQRIYCSTNTNTNTNTNTTHQHVTAWPPSRHHPSSLSIPHFNQSVSSVARPFTSSSLHPYNLIMFRFINFPTSFTRQSFLLTVIHLVHTYNSGSDRIPYFSSFGTAL
ncbi:hypothetical protein B0F90DRAFT_1095970 [Multifurca ochricompacta]|uniref:Uncharacterized protein n=1 Tax=Multifurca ochricompacta TaxID=376703 RepID=A0AAD4M931_9AGAM|nr:hypothetical protein B0F90DRAFT_1095970 [Multifurca ochricompacta]